MFSLLVLSLRFTQEKITDSITCCGVLSVLSTDELSSFCVAMLRFFAFSDDIFAIFRDKKGVILAVTVTNIVFITKTTKSIFVIFYFTSRVVVINRGVSHPE